MKSINQIYAFIFLVLLGCGNINSEKEKIIQEDNFKIKNKISSIKVYKNNDTIFIDDSLKIKSIINNLSKSKIEYIKFGSSDEMLFYDKNNKEVLKVSFRKDKFKINGITYKCDSTIIK